jgi:murein DD-endopeptidase MepM/ murein hydrolase activator NlpD
MKSFFSLPVIGWNWGQLHNYNAVDIANQCGTPVQAAAEGLVVSDAELGSGSGGWNDGYGSFVLIEHPNGTKTRYAHLDKTLVKAGDYVARGEEIGMMGNTGSTHGPTGCHIHFEVYGAKNPFAVSK